MRKKKVISNFITVVCLLICVSITGCGQNTNSNSSGSVNGSSNTNASGSATNTKDASKLPEVPDLSSEWAKYDIHDVVVQVEDKLYVVGKTMEDTMNTVKSSAVSFEYDYNPDKLVPANEVEMIDIKFSGKVYFSIKAWNPYQEARELSKCVVYFDYQKSDEDLLKRCKIIDGTSYEELLKLSYSDAKELAKTKFAGLAQYSLREDTIYYENNDFNRLTIDYTFDNVPMKEQNLENVEMSYSWIQYRFYINKDTSKVESITFKTLPSCSYK